MTVQSERDDSKPSIASVPSTRRQRRIAVAFSIGILLAFGGVAVVALTPLPRVDGYIPAIQALIASTDFITAVLLFAQYATERSRALLLLAAGYLFTGLTVVAHTLTFPGAFTPTGLLGAGAQTAAWLYVVWHLVFPAAALAYALLKQEPIATEGIQAPSAVAIRRTVIVVVTAVCLLTWAAIVGGDSLPTLVVSETTFATTASVVTVSALVMSMIAFGVLWSRRTTVLDEWLIVALSASIAETALVVFVGASRYTVAFYASRPFALIASSAVLVALVSEMTRLHMRLSGTVKALERERATRLINLDVIVGSIAHQIKQPLTVITTCGAVVQSLLREPKIDRDEVKLNLDDMTHAGRRVGETIDSLRTLLKNPSEVQQRVDVNEVALESLQLLKAPLSEHDIAVTTELTKGLPPVIAHRGQLREAFINIVQNAIDAMATVADRRRTLHIRTRRGERDRISIAIEDSGPGIEPERLANLFTAFVSTKERGMGWGLGICQMIVDRHNGKLSVSSEIGKGTRFDVTLPVESVAAPETARVGGSVKAEA